jgi:hypothetical protein
MKVNWILAPKTQAFLEILRERKMPHAGRMLCQRAACYSL